MKEVSIKEKSRRFTVGKIICIGQNYAKHAKEMNFDIPQTPVFFLKPPSALIGDGEHIVMPSISNDVHHEVELTVLIGNGGKNISEESALSRVAGYGVGLDMTMRDIQLEAKKQGLPWTLAKGFDTSAPVSEFIAAQKIGDPSALSLELKINGAIRQASSTRIMVFSVAQLISYISQFISFDAGDIIYTGTPEGVSQVHHGDKLEASLNDSSGKTVAALHVGVL